MGRSMNKSEQSEGLCSPGVLDGGVPSGDRVRVWGSLLSFNSPLDNKNSLKT